MPKPSLMVTSARMIFLGFCSSVIVIVDFLITDLAQAGFFLTAHHLFHHWLWPEPQPALEITVSRSYLNVVDVDSFG
jgi:hypothetical protein